jgi:hypothetical protein
MSKELDHLAERIRSELVELELILERVNEGWQRAKRSSDEYYVDGVALNLHGLYSGLERIFVVIATVVDGFKPTGEMWHKTLLQQMAE